MLYIRPALIACIDIPSDLHTRDIAHAIRQRQALQHAPPDARDAAYNTDDMTPIAIQHSTQPSYASHMSMNHITRMSDPFWHISPRHVIPYLDARFQSCRDGLMCHLEMRFQGMQLSGEMERQEQKHGQHNMTARKHHGNGTSHQMT